MRRTNPKTTKPGSKSHGLYPPPRKNDTEVLAGWARQQAKKFAEDSPTRAQWEAIARECEGYISQKGTQGDLMA